MGRHTALGSRNLSSDQSRCFVLSLLSLALFNVEAASAVQTPILTDCALETRLSGEAVLSDEIGILFETPKGKNCVRAPGFYGMAPRGIRMTPHIDGVWSWVWGEELRFTPAVQWPANTRFTVDLSDLTLPPATSLQTKKLVFETPVLHARHLSARFMADPAVDGQKFLTLQADFSTRVMKKTDIESSFVIKTPASVLKLGQPNFVWLSNDTSLLVKIPVRELPESEKLFEAAFKQIPLIIREWNGKIEKTDSAFRVPVPGKNQFFRLSGFSVDTNFDRDLKPIHRLTLESSLALRPADLSQVLVLTALPEKLDPSALTPTDWRLARRFTPDVLAHGKVLRLKPLSDPAIPITTLRFEIEGLDNAQSNYLHLAVPAGFGPGGDYRLNTPLETVVKRPDPSREIRFLSPGHLMILTGTQTLTLQVEGIRKIRWTVGRVRDAFLATEAASYATLTQTQMNESNVEIRSGEMTLATGTSFVSLDLRQIGFADRPAGLFDITVEGFLEDENGRWIKAASADKRVLVSDLALIHKEAADGSLEVFTHNLTTDQPAAGVEVTLLAANGLPITRRFTNRDGIVRFSSVKGLVLDKRPVALIARDRSRGDLAWLSIADSRNRVYNSFANYGRHVRAEELTGLVFTERGLYRPGETVHIGLLAVRGDLTRTDESLPVQLEVTDPAGRLALRESVLLSSDGIASVDKKLLAGDLPGRWRMTLKAGEEPIGSAYFDVRDFDAERMTLTITPSVRSPGWLTPDEAALSLELKNNFGTPAEDRLLQITGTVTPVPRMQWPGFDGWHFSDPSALDARSEDLPTVRGRTDGTGHFQLAPSVFAGATGGVRVTLSAQGFEPAGSSSATDETTLHLSPLETMLGWKLTDPNLSPDNLNPQKSTRVEFVLVNRHLERMAGREINVEKRRIDYRTALFEDARGELRYRTQPVGRTIEKIRLTTDLNGEAVWFLNKGNRDPQVATGDYELRLTDQDGVFLGQLAYRLTDTGLLAAREETLPGASMTLHPISPELSAGTTATADLIAPFDGTVLLTLETDRVLTYRRLKVKEGRNTLSFDIPKHLRGRAVLNAALIRFSHDRSRLQKGFARASAAVVVNDDRVKLTPTLSVPTRAESPRSIPVTIRTERPGHFWVWAVDEGLLRLTGYQTPDPKGTLLDDRALGVTTYESLDELMPEDLPIPSPVFSLYGGGEDSADKVLGAAMANPFRRTAEKATVWWGGLIETGPMPKTLRMTLPEGFNGRVRLMAVGAGESEIPGTLALGCAQTTTEVREPVVLTGALPSFAAPGDRLTAALTLVAREDGQGEMRLASPVPGPSYPLTLTADRETTLFWDLTAPEQPGETRLVFEGRLNDRALAKTLSIGIRPASLPERESYWGYLPDTKRFTFPTLAPVVGAERISQASVSTVPIPLIAVLADSFGDSRGDLLSRINRALADLAVLEIPQVEKTLGYTEKRISCDEKFLADTISELERQMTQNSLSGGYFEEEQLTTAVRSLDLLLSLERSGRLAHRPLLEKTVELTKREISLQLPKNLAEARLQAYGLMLVTLEGTLVPEELENLRAHLDEAMPDWKNDTTALFFARAYRVMRMDEEARALEGPKLLDSASPNDLSLFGMMSPTAAYALWSVWDPDADSQKLVDAVLAQSPGSLLELDRAALLQMLSVRLRSETSKRTLTELSLRCVEPDPSADASSHEGTSLGNETVRTLDVPGCRRFEVVSPFTLGDLYWQTTAAGYSVKPPEEALRQGLYVNKRVSVNGRALFADDGAEHFKPGESPLLKVGDVLDVTIDIRREAGDASSPVLVTDLLPGGTAWVTQSMTLQKRRIDPQVSDDRLSTRFVIEGTTAHLCYQIRLVAPGEFLIPSITATDLGNENIRARTAATKRIRVESH